MANVNRVKPIVAIEALSYGEVLAKLEFVKKEHKEFDKGYRKTLYGFLQQAAEMALLLEVDEDMKSRFRKKTGEEDVLRGVLIFISDAQSAAEKKEASKRALALRHLIEKLKVAVEDIATAIPRHGGIEKLARAAAKSPPDEVDEDRDDEDDEDQDKPEEADENDETESKLGNRIRVGLSPKLTKKLNRFADKTRIKIIGYVRISSDEPLTIEAKKIVKLKTKVASKEKPDDEDDWEE
jgi:hypothetical protein